MVAEHLKNKPYELRWRFEFFEDLTKVAHINGKEYDLKNLSSEDLKEIEDEFGYLKNIDAFNLCMDYKLSPLVKEGVSYVDFVCKGNPNKDENTYWYSLFWESSLGEVLLDSEGNDAPFSDEGLYQFTNDELPLHIKVIENGRVYADYLKGFFWSEVKCPVEELEVAEIPKMNKFICKVDDPYTRMVYLLKNPEKWSESGEYDRYALEHYGNNICNTTRLGWVDTEKKDEIAINIIVQLDGYLPENLYNGEWKVNDVSPDAYWQDVAWIPFMTVERGKEDIMFTKEKYDELCDLLSKDTLIMEHESSFVFEKDKKLYDTWKKYCYEKQWDGLPNLPVNAHECSLESKIHKAVDVVKSGPEPKKIDEKEIDGAVR